jgi:hypothetical protein
MDVAISSFIITQDYDQSSDILISRADTCVLTCLVRWSLSSAVFGVLVMAPINILISIGVHWTSPKSPH